MTALAPQRSVARHRLLSIVRLHLANPATLLVTPLAILGAIFVMSALYFEDEFAAIMLGTAPRLLFGSFAVIGPLVMGVTYVMGVGGVLLHELVVLGVHPAEARRPLLGNHGADDHVLARRARLEVERRVRLGERVDVVYHPRRERAAQLGAVAVGDRIRVGEDDRAGGAGRDDERVHLGRRIRNAAWRIRHVGGGEGRDTAGHADAARRGGRCRDERGCQGDGK